MAGFDDPAAGAPPGLAQLVVHLLSPRADVGGETVCRHQLPGLFVVIGFVQTDTLGCLGGGLRPFDGDGIEHVFEKLVVIAVGAVVSQADRHPGSLGHDRAFRPFLALSVGLGPVFPWPSGALVMAPSTERKLQSMPTCSSYSKSPSRQNSWNTFARSHSWKRRWAEELEQMPVTFRAFHCMPVRKTKR